MDHHADKSSNFKGRKRQSGYNNCNLSPLTKKTKASDSVFVGENTNVYTRFFKFMMKTCEVYDDDKWYKGTIMGCEQRDGIWKYKITLCC